MIDFIEDVWSDIKDDWSDFWDDLQEGDILGAAENLLKLGATAATLGSYNVFKVGFESLIDIPEIDIPESIFQDRKVTVRGSIEPRTIIYGRVLTGGQLIYAESNGDDDEWMHLIIVWSTHPCESCDTFYFNGEPVVVGGVRQGNYGSDQNWLQFITHLGDQTDYDPIIASDTPSWGQDHKLLGCTYTYFRLRYNRELYPNGLPNITALIEGKNDIYDPRNDSYIYTDNHSLCTLDYMRYVHGMNIADGAINMQTFADGANVCDELVTDSSNGLSVEKRYTVNGTIKINNPPLSNLISLYKAGAARILYTQGLWEYIPGTFEAPTVDDHYNEDDLVGGLDFSPGLSRKNRINTITGSYASMFHDYEATDIVPVSVPAYVTQDLEVLSRDMKFPFATSPALARRLAKIELETSRYGANCSMYFKVKGFRLKVGQRIYFSSKTLNWENRIFKVISVDFSRTKGVKVALREDSADIYNWGNSDISNPIVPPALNLPLPSSATNPTNLNVTQAQYVSENSTRIRNALTLTYTQGSLSSNKYDIQFRDVTEGTWRYVAVEWLAESFTVKDLDAGQYQFRIQAVNGLDFRAQTWVETATINVVNLTNGTIDTVAPLAPITNLQLESGTSLFTGRDAKFYWDSDNNKLSYFLYYLVEILNGSAVVIRTETTTNPFYVYSGEKNIEDGNNRAFTIRVTAISRNLNDLGNNHTSASVTLAVSNPAPALPSGLTLTEGYDLVNISYQESAELDITNISVWLSDTSGFTPDSSNLVAKTLANPIIVNKLNSNQTYYLRLAVNDSFGQGTISSEIAFTTQQAVYPGLSPWATVTDADRAFIDANLENGSIASEKIDKLVASKIVTGTLAATEAISVEGTVEVIDGNYKTVLGPRALNSKTAMLSFTLNNTPIFALYTDGTSYYSGAIAIGAGSSGYSALTDKPDNLADLNSTEGAKLAGIADGADVTDYTDERVNNNNVVPFTFVTTASITAIGNKVYLPAATGTWNQSAYTQEKFKGSAYISFTAPQNNARLMIGFSTNPSSSVSYDSMEHAIYLRNDGVLQSRSPATTVQVESTYNAGDLFELIYDGQYVIFLINGVEFDRRVELSDQTFHLDIALRDSGATVTNLNFLPYVNYLDSRIDNNNAVTVNWIPSSNIMTANANTLVKESGTDAWEAYCVTEQRFNNAAMINFKSVMNGYYYVGLVQTPASLPTNATGPNSAIDAAFYLRQGNTYRIFLGSALALGDTAYTIGDTFTVIYTGAEYKFYVNGQLVLRKYAPAEQSFYGLYYPYNTGHKVSSVLFTQYADVTDEAINNNSASPFTFNSNTVNVLVKGSVIEQIGVDVAWGNYTVISEESFARGAYASFKVDVDGVDCAVGLDRSPSAGASFTTIDHCIQLGADNVVRIYHNGVLMFTGASNTVAVGDLFAITYDGYTVNYYRNGSVIYATVPSNKNMTLYLISAFKDQGSKISSVQFGSFNNATYGNLAEIPDRLTDTATVGLNLTSTHMGYYDGTSWKSWFDDTGNMYLSGSGANSLSWNGTDLDIIGNINGSVITGGTLQTQVTDERVVISDIDNRIHIYWDASEGETGIYNDNIRLGGKNSDGQSIFAGVIGGTGFAQNGLSIWCDNSDYKALKISNGTFQIIANDYDGEDIFVIDAAGTNQTAIKINTYNAIETIGDIICRDIDASQVIVNRYYDPSIRIGGFSGIENGRTVYECLIPLTDVNYMTGINSVDIGKAVAVTNFIQDGVTFAGVRMHEFLFEVSTQQSATSPSGSGANNTIGIIAGIRAITSNEEGMLGNFQSTINTYSATHAICLVYTMGPIVPAKVNSSGGTVNYGSPLTVDANTDGELMESDSSSLQTIGKALGTVSGVSAGSGVRIPIMLGGW